MASTGKTKASAKPAPKSAVSAQKPAAKVVAAKPESKVAAKAAVKAIAKPVAAEVAPAPAPAPVAKRLPPAPTAASRPVVLSLNAHKKYAGLTEAEIMKQPESEYMSKAQLAFFHEKLNELRGTIIFNASDTGEHLRDAEVATDPSDRATQEEEYTLELRTRDRERKLLRKVDKVIRMIEDGSFGWCEETGEPIGLARLIARPTATLSIEAQERRERMQKLFGD
ncbi:MAG: RNA polymerase-binding protein DksA [Betaproteobacteria bacterium]|nr:MAG: RNA polymerase-binding protein DksA [Betaproteobacteria bacterium]